jgi:hypothetical protein
MPVNALFPFQLSTRILHSEVNNILAHLHTTPAQTCTTHEKIFRIPNRIKRIQAQA